MSCNIKRIKGCEIAGSTFNGRKLSLNRDFSNDTFKAKVKTFNQKPIAEITGVKNATDVYFPFNGLENLSAGLYLIEYWGNFEDIGNELFCVEEFSVVAPSKAGEAQCCDNNNVFNFVTEDVSIDIQITATIVNIGGCGDISNLVPYTGATKDVNIGANYFKTSKGFDSTFDDDNYFITHYSGDYNLLEFSSKDISSNNFGEVRFRVNPDEGLLIQKITDNGIYNNFRISEYETYSSKPFLSNVGFKTTTGTATQALRADGGVFDLNTKADLVSGKVPSSQLPSYVDDVLEFANLSSFPATGESGKIYIAIDTNLTYRWGGSSYVVMSSSLALGETASTAYRGDNGKTAYDHSQATGNPHGTTKSDIGLGNVDNTSDLDKPISTATQLALNTKADIDDIPTKTSFTHDILVANWNLVSGKYEAVISNVGILADSFVDIIPSNDHVDIVRSAQIYPSVLISAGSVKVYSKFLPSGTISVTVN